MTTRKAFTDVCMVLLLSASALAWANEVDEAGNLIATPREAEMMEKGFLYFPPRVVRKPVAAKPTEAKPTEAKPTEAKPTEAKPTEVKPPESQVKSLETVPALPTATVVSDPQAVPVLVADPAPPAVAAPAGDKVPVVDVPPVAPRLAGEKILLTNPHNRLSSPPQFAHTSAYAGVGTGTVVGLSTPLPEGGAFRVEFSDGAKSPQANRSYGSDAYRTQREEQQLGLFVDWSPNNDNWFVTGGLTLNNHQIKVHAQPSSAVVVNGISATVGTSGYLNFDYKLPLITPYLGVRYVLKPYNDKGWEGFGEVGVLLGKLNGDGSSNMSDFTNADVATEAANVRKSIYRWSVVPKVVVGLSYKY